MSSLKDNNYRDAFNNALWRFIGLTLLGVLGGFLVYRSSEKSGEANVWYFVFIALLCFVIGLVIFLVRYIKLKKKYKGDKND